MKLIYDWSEGTTFTKKADPQKVGERLEAIRRRNGDISPEAVVADAKNPRSPMHRVFDWDDASAASKYRLEQARNMIRHLIVIDDEAERPPFRAFVSIRKEDTAYQSIDAALSDPEWRVHILQRAKRELAAVAARYRDLQELDEVINAIERIAA